MHYRCYIVCTIFSNVVMAVWCINYILAVNFPSVISSSDRPHCPPPTHRPWSSTRSHCHTQEGGKEGASHPPEMEVTKDVTASVQVCQGGLHGVFICQSSPTMATYCSTLLNTSIPGLTNASSLVSYVQEWVAAGPVVRLDWLLVRVNKVCPVAIHQLNDPECPAPHSLQPELVNHINSVRNTCTVRSLGLRICEPVSALLSMAKCISN